MSVKVCAALWVCVCNISSKCTLPVSPLSLYQCIFAVAAGAWKAFRTLAHREQDLVSNTHMCAHTHDYLSYRVITGL